MLAAKVYTECTRERVRLTIREGLAALEEELGYRLEYDALCRNDPVVFLSLVERGQALLDAGDTLEPVDIILAAYADFRAWFHADGRAHAAACRQTREELTTHTPAPRGRDQPRREAARI